MVDDITGELNYGKGHYKKLRNSFGINWADVFHSLMMTLTKCGTFLRIPFFHMFRNVYPQLVTFVS